MFALMLLAQTVTPSIPVNPVGPTLSPETGVTGLAAGGGMVITALGIVWGIIKFYTDKAEKAQALFNERADKMTTAFTTLVEKKDAQIVSLIQKAEEAQDTTLDRIETIVREVRADYQRQQEAWMNASHQMVEAIGDVTDSVKELRMSLNGSLGYGGASNPRNRRVPAPPSDGGVA